MKKFILGFITGGIICATVTGLAVEYAVTANPFPVKVNGVETAIEGYNINDSTYFKLRDIADAVGGFNVDFKDNTIVLETQAAAETAPTPTPTVNSITVNTSELNEDGTRKYTVDGLLIEYYEGVGYVNARNIEKTYNTLILGIAGASLYDKKGNKVLENIKTDTVSPDNIDLSYYENTLYPFILTLAE